MQDAEECPIGLRVIRNFGVIPGVTNCVVLRDAAFGSAQICCLSSQTAASQEALMSIKRILVPLPGSASHTGEIELALSAAKALGAHVQALFISQPERTAGDAREVFAQACAKVGIPMLSANDEPGSPLAASWREAEGSYVEIAVQRAAAFDLVVAASATRDGIAHGHCRAIAAADPSPRGVGAGSPA